MPQAAAHDGLLPSRFASQSNRGVPAFGIVVGTVLASVLTIVSYTSFTKVFTTVVLLSVLTAVIPYLFSAAAQVYWLATEGRRLRAAHLARDLGVSLTALLFGFWALAGSGYQAVYYGLFSLLLGIPAYVWLKAERREYGETPVTPRSTVDGALS
jgi:APA family basic amino acid/polyamine antiporter